jgi:uncharacterized cupredoxin-like copper-binding protein
MPRVRNTQRGTRASRSTFRHPQGRVLLTPPQGIGPAADPLDVARFPSVRFRVRVPKWGTLGLLPLLAAGCGGAQSSSGAATAVIAVTERDFAISLPRVVRAGDVVFRVQNRGPDAHELLVVRAPKGHLPMRSDGLTVNEEQLQRSEVGVLEPAETNAVRDLHLRLKPGRYVLFCNMSGHFMGGMHQTLVVR